MCSSEATAQGALKLDNYTFSKAGALWGLGFGGAGVTPELAWLVLIDAAGRFYSVTGV